MNVHTVFVLKRFMFINDFIMYIVQFHKIFIFEYMLHKRYYAFINYEDNNIMKGKLL